MIMLLDNGVSGSSAEDLLYFFDTPRLRKEIENVDLAVFKENVAKSLEKVLNT